MRNSISHIALFASAIFALTVSVAQAQGVNDPNYQISGLGTYNVVGSDGSPNGSAYVIGSSQILEDAKGNPADASHLNSDGTPKAGYQWVSATYTDLAKAESVDPYLTKDGKYLVDPSTGAVLPKTAVIVPANYVAVDPSGVAPASYRGQFSSSSYAASYHGIDGFGLSNGQTSTALTTAGVAVSDNKGNTTTVGSSSISVVGPNGSVVIADPSVTVTSGTNVTSVVATAAGTGLKVSATGGTATLASTSGAAPLLTIQDTAGHATVVGATGVATNGFLATTDGTATGTTVIQNGVVAAGTSVNAPVVNAGVAYVGVANVGTTNTGNLNVASGGNIDMGGNRVQDVAAPISALDATNKAYVDKGLNKAYEGTAIALSLSTPVLVGNQSFAVRAGWGDYQSQDAFGLSAVGIIGRDWFGNGSTVALDGGVGFGSSNTIAGKAGVTVGFGGGYVPLK